MARCILLGTAAALPSATRDNTALVFVGTHSSILVDCPGGAYAKLLRPGVAPAALTRQRGGGGLLERHGAGRGGRAAGGRRGGPDPRGHVSRERRRGGRALLAYHVGTSRRGGAARRCPRAVARALHAPRAGDGREPA